MKRIDIKVLDEARDFIKSIDNASARRKIYYVLDRIKLGEKDNEIFKKLDDTDIWEFRILFAKIAYRLFAFWDTSENALIVATHGIIKKTQKTPTKEIRKAERIREEYFYNKKEITK